MLTHALNGMNIYIYIYMCIHSQTYRVTPLISFNLFEN